MSEGETIEIARKHAEAQGWPFEEPVWAHLTHHQKGKRSVLAYHVMTNTNYRGGNVNIYVDADGGTVLFAAFARR